MAYPIHHNPCLSWPFVFRGWLFSSPGFGDTLASGESIPILTSMIGYVLIGTYVLGYLLLYSPKY